MNLNYKKVKQLSENDILDLGKTLTGKSSTRLKKYELTNGVLYADYRIDCNAPKGKSVLEHSKIYNVLAEFNDYGLDGTINSFYPLNSQKYFERFVAYMINRFGKDYAIELYNYHKQSIDKISEIANLMERASDVARDNPDVANYLREKAHNMTMDYEKKLAKLKALINENLYGNDKIDDFDILNNI